MTTTLSTRRPAPFPPQNTVGSRPEKFMGTAEQVRPSNVSTVVNPPPAREASPGVSGAGQKINSTRPAPGRANLMGSGSAPIGGTGGAPASAPGRLAGLAGKARPLINGAMGKLVVGAAGAQAVGDSMDEDSTARYAKRFGVAEPTGDGSVGDIAKFVGLRAGGFASDLGNRLTMGLAGSLYQDNPGSAAAAPVQTPAEAAGAAPGATNAVQMAPDASGQVKTAPTASLTGTALRKVVAPGAAPLYTNDPADPAGQAFGGTVSTVGGGQETMNTLQRAADVQRQITSLRTGMQDRGAMFGRGPDLGVGGETAGGLSAENSAQLRRLMSGRGRMSGVALNAMSNIMQDATARRGQDITAGGVAARSASDAAKLRFDATKAQQDQANSDRDYNLRAGDASLKQTQNARAQEQQDFTQRETAAKNVSARYEKMFATPDGKVDTQKVATYMQGVNAALGHRMAAAEREIAAGGADAARAQQELTLMKTKGLAALGEKELAEIDSLMQTRERVMASDGFMPGSANYVDSVNPYDFAATGAEQNTFGSDTVSLRGGSKVRKDDLRYKDGPANAVLPDWFKTETRDFDLAKQGLRK